MSTTFRDIPVPRDPYLSTPRLTPPTPAQVEQELGEEEGIAQAAQFMLRAYHGDRERAVMVLRRWVRETGNRRWGFVADHIEGMPPVDSGT